MNFYEGKQLVDMIMTETIPLSKEQAGEDELIWEMVMEWVEESES